MGLSPTSGSVLAVRSLLGILSLSSLSLPLTLSLSKQINQLKKIKNKNKIAKSQPERGWSHLIVNVATCVGL